MMGLTGLVAYLMVLLLTSSPLLLLKMLFRHAFCRKGGKMHGLLCQFLELEIGTFPLTFISEEHEQVRKSFLEFMSNIKQFVKGVVQNREKSRVKRFQLCLDPGCFWPYTPQAIGGCIVHAMMFKPQMCSVFVALHEHLNLNTDPIFTCASLCHLKLQLCAGVYGEDHEFVTPSSINLPYLESLILGFVTVRDDFVKKLLTGCPLEELVLSDCSMQIADIRSDKLKNLVLRGCSTDFCTQPQVFEY